MRPFIIIIYLLVCSRMIAVPLSGTYTIGGLIPDFVSINSAITALDSNGVNGSVIFNIRDGIYNEGLKINSIPGASSINTITFQSENHDSTLVELNFTTNSTQQNGIFLNKAKYIRFHQISLVQPPSTSNSSVIFINRGNYLSFTNCNVRGNGYSTSSQSDYVIRGCCDTGMVIRNCNLSGGFDGVYLSSINANAFNLVVEKNHFFNISHDILSLNQCYYSEVSNNIIDGINSGGGTSRGIIFQNVYQTNVFNNIITILNAQLNTCGIQIISSNGTALNHSKVYNNLISVTINPFNTIVYGVRCNTTSNYDFCNNNISMYGGSSVNTGFALDISGTNYGIDSLLILNNIIARFDNNLTASVIKTALTGPNVRSDYNLIYSAYGLIAPTYSSFSQYQTSTLRDAHSISIDPQFFSTINLQANAWQLINAGTPMSYIFEDILGDIRNPLHPSIGAYENSMLTRVESKSFTQENSEIICYPNPAISSINFGHIFSKNIIVQNSLGEIVFSKQNCDDSETIDLSGFVNGLYFMRVVNEKSLKFIKK